MTYQIPRILDFSVPVTGLEVAGNLPACLYSAVQHIPENRRKYMLKLADFSWATYLFALDINLQTGSRVVHQDKVGSLLHQSFFQDGIEVLPNESFVHIAPMPTENFSDKHLLAWMGKVLNKKNFMWHKLDDEQLHILFFTLYKATAFQATSENVDSPYDFDWAGRLSQLYRASSVVTRCKWRGWNLKGFRPQIVQYMNAGLRDSYPFVVRKVD